MTEATKRGGPREGAGRKPKSPTGEAMRPRQVRMTDDQWEDRSWSLLTRCAPG